MEKYRILGLLVVLYLVGLVGIGVSGIFMFEIGDGLSYSIIILGLAYLLVVSSIKYNKSKYIPTIMSGSGMVASVVVVLSETPPSIQITVIGISILSAFIGGSVKSIVRDAKPIARKS